MAEGDLKMSELTDRMFQNFWKGHKTEKSEKVMTKQEASQRVANNEQLYMKSPKSTISRQELYEKLKRIESRNNNII